MSLKLKQLPPEERPRERLIQFGPRILTNTELLAIMLSKGTKQQNVLTLAKRLLQESTLQSLSRKRINSLLRLKGIGEAKACQMLACFELGRRVAASKNKSGVQINNAVDVVNQFLPRLAFLTKEHFMCVFLDTRQRIIKDEIIFIGTLSTSVVHPREIFQAAYQENAAALILVHNHPSGDPTPSDDDIDITHQLCKSGEILGIPILDHIIVANNNYFSFKEKGYC